MHMSLHVIATCCKLQLYFVANCNEITMMNFAIYCNLQLSSLQLGLKMQSIILQLELKMQSIILQLGPKMQSIICNLQWHCNDIHCKLAATFNANCMINKLIHVHTCIYIYIVYHCKGYAFLCVWHRSTYHMHIIIDVGLVAPFSIACVYSPV